MGTDMSIQERFEEFHKNFPQVYMELVKLAREVKAKGFDTYSIKQLWGVLRWHQDIKCSDGSGYKLNDAYYSRYARLIMETEPDLKDFFKTRVLRTMTAYEVALLKDKEIPLASVDGPLFASI